MRNGTLSRKLFIRIVPTIVVTILLIGALAFRSARTEINTVYDAQLINDANVLWKLVSDDIDDIEAGSPKRVADIDLSLGNQNALNHSADEYGDSRMFRVWRSGMIIIYSDTAPPVSVPAQSPGFSTILFSGDPWRLYTLPIPGQPFSIEVGEKFNLRNTLVSNILLNLALPLLLLVPIVGVLIWVGIGNGLGIIRSLVDQIHKRSSYDLSHVDIKHLPEDLMPLGASINQLLTKLEHSFTAEQRFTDHAAHQLRTPLATIKLQLQMLAKAEDMQERHALMQELLTSSERTAKLINTLLTLARLSYQPIHLHPVALYPAAASVMATLGLLAKQKHIEMSLTGNEQLQVIADETLLKLMLGNIIENAIKYTPTYGVVSVSLHLAPRICQIIVSDTGPGIPEHERALVFERFYRVDTPEIEGTGLGLTIAAEIAERFSGHIALETVGLDQGLKVIITLPLDQNHA